MKTLHPSWIAYFPLPHRFSMFCTAAIVALSFAGCATSTRQKEPVNAQPLPLAPVIWYSPSVTAAEARYDNACGEKSSVAFVDTVVGSVPQKLKNVFTEVSAQRQAEEPLASDGVIEVGIGHKRIDLVIPQNAQGTYPVTATVGMEMVFLARDGTLLFSKKLEGTGRGTVMVAEQSCQVEGLGVVLQEAINSAADQLGKLMAQSSPIQDYAARRGTWSSMAVLPHREAMSSATGTAAIPPTTVPATIEPPQSAPIETVQPAQLGFRAIIRDETRDQLLEPDEALTIEVEIKNEGLGEAKDVVIMVEGKAELDALFPSEVVIGTLQPGEIKRTALTKRVSLSDGALHAELSLKLRTTSPVAGVSPSKVFTLGVKPKSQGAAMIPDVDQMPPSLMAFQQPKSVVITIGVGTFLDEQMPEVKYAGHDAQVMAEYLRAIGNVPGERIRVLLGRKARSQDFEDTFEQWLRKRADRETVVYVFFAGRAVVDGETGSILLVPHDGTLSEVKQLYPLRRLQEALYQLPIRRAILMFDVSMDPSPGFDLAAIPAPAWESEATEARKGMEMWMIGNRKLQEAHAHDQGKHGLFTYYLLRGLQGVADLDRNGTVTAGELCTYARSQVALVARDKRGNKQDPLCLPHVGREGMARVHPIAKGNNPKSIAMPKESESPVGASTPSPNLIQVVP